MRNLIVFAAPFLWSCSSAIPYQQWQPTRSHDDIGTGYRFDSLQDGAVSAMYEHAKGSDHEAIRALLERASGEYCQGEYRLYDIQELDIIVTHSDMHSAKINAKVSCLNENM